ncbi:hypothetical protein BH11BAC1_BH11BAC1_25800 [soil metagenome]
MKIIKYLTVSFLLLNLTVSAALRDSSKKTVSDYPVRKLTIEPAIGMNPMPLSDVLLSNLVQWNLKKRLSIISHSAFVQNNAFLRDFNFIKTNYNYSLNQKFGIGTSFFSKHFSHTFSLMAGIKYDNFKETMNNPEFEKVVVKISSLSPDFGLMYNLKIGQKKYFFSYRMYIPLYPYPMKSLDLLAVDGNMANLSVEIGFGIRLK